MRCHGAAAQQRAQLRRSGGAARPQRPCSRAQRSMPDVWGGDPGGGRACSVERMGVRGGPAPLAARSACTCAPRRAGRCEAAPASLLRLEATVAGGPPGAWQATPLRISPTACG